MTAEIDIARQRIAQEAEAKTGSLNLSRIGLTALPDEMSGLTHLQRLNCHGAEIRDLTPLAGLTNLQSLDCTFTQVSDLKPLAGLTSLQSLDCSLTQG